MLKISKCLMVLFVSGALGCAVAPPRVVETGGGFSETPDLVSVSLAREGMGLVKQSRFREGELKFRQALYLTPGLETLRINLAQALLGAGEEKEALAILEGLPQVTDKQKQKRAMLLAQAVAATSDWKSAIPMFDAIIDKAQTDNDYTTLVTATRSRSSLAFRAGNELEAVEWSSTANGYANSANDEMLRHLRVFLITNRFQLLLDTAKPILDVADNPAVRRYEAFALAATGANLDARDEAQRTLDTGTALLDEEKQDLYRIRIATDPALKELTSMEREMLYSPMTDEDLLRYPPALIEQIRVVQERFKES